MSGLRAFTPPMGASSGPAGKNKVVLGDRFMLGEELGRGAYGQVYKGIDLTSGEAVAIKQISLAGISQDNLQSVMGEIELLKTLNHKNIVKYLGSFKTRTHLYIILEYMENGALSALLKPNRFGVFPETLVAVYIAQVLQGLQYLHDQGVVHRDIKGANILTTKEGLVKLADFGVAAKLGELEERRDELQQHVVGTPYWMAPEVIEMTQVTSASDIWSVGCLIVELLTGSPPYYDLQPMSALFRIVQDPHPPLPDNLTPLMLDFLTLCFQKDPRKRPDARTLLQHEWVQANRRTLRNSWRRGQPALTAGRGGRAPDAHESVTSVIARMVQADEGEEDGAGAGGQGIVTPSHIHLGNLPQEFSPSNPSPSLPGPPAALAGRGAVYPSPLRDGALAYPSPPPPLNTQPLTPPLPQGQTVAPSAVPLPPLPQYAPQPGTQQQEQWATPSAPAAGGAGGADEGPLGDFMSRLQGEMGTSAGGAVGVMGGAGARGQLDSWLQDASATMGSTMDPRRGGGLLFGAQVVAGGGMGGGVAGVGGDGQDGLDDMGLGPVSTSSTALELKRKVTDLVRALRPVPGGGRDAGSLTPPAACREMAALVARSAEAKQHFLGEGGVLVLLELLDSADARNGEGALDLMSVLTEGDVRLLESLCLVGVVPAATRYALAPHPPAVRLRAAAFVASLVFTGDSTLHMFVACQGLRQLVAMVSDTTGTSAPTVPSPDSPGLAGTQTAIACIWRLLETYASLPLNYLCRLLAQAGLVPRLFTVLKQTWTQLAKGRPAAASAQGAAADGRPGSTAAAANSRSLPAMGGAGEPTAALAAAASAATNAYQTMDPRMFAKANSMQGTRGSPSAMTVDPRSMARAAAAGGAGPSGAGVHVDLATAQAMSAAPLSFDAVEALQDRVVTLLLVLSHADAAVKGFMASRDNLQLHFEALTKVTHLAHLVKLLRALRWLTCEASVLPAVKDAGAIPALVPFLDKGRADAAGQVGYECQLEALQALYNICKFNKKVHLEAAATYAAIPHLVDMAKDGIKATAAAEAAALAAGGPGSSTAAPSQAAAGDVAAASARWASLRGYVVPMLVGMVSCSSSTRSKLLQAQGIDVFLALLAQPDGQVQVGVLGALEVWLMEDHARVEARLTQKEVGVTALVGLYARAAQAGDTASAPQLLDLLKNMLGRSSKLAVALAAGGLVPCLLALITPAAPILRVKLLDIIQLLYEHHPRPKDFLMQHNIPALLKTLLSSGGRGADAVHQSAQRLLTAFQINVLF